MLKKASVPFIMVPETFDHDGILEKIRVVGKALGADDKAAELAAAVEADLEGRREADRRHVRSASGCSSS